MTAAGGGRTGVVDVAVVGGGIVGLATAHALVRSAPSRSVVVLDKEPGLARHQTGRNSGVVHSGLYYRPGSLKARMCLAGNRSMVDFARRHDVPVAVTGKLVVATRISELDGLAALERRGRDHGLAVRRLGPREAAELEPHLRCVAALHVPTTGVVDFVAVSERLAQLVREAGGEIRTGARVTAVRASGGVQRITTTAGDVEARRVVNCAGLQSDRVAGLAGAAPPARIVPFRGEYLELRPSARHLVRGLIYPVPDPDFPFLGVHLTRGVDGGVHAGPNAVLALAREGYRRRDVVPADVWDTLSYRGFRSLAGRHARQGAAEVLRSLWRPAFVRSLQAMVPELSAEDLVAAPAGVRAQAVAPDGALVDDFLLVDGPGALHVLNAPSPAATSSLEIGAEIARRLTP